MGRRGGRRPRRGGQGGQQRSVQRTDYREIAKENELFVRYYNGLDLVDEGQRDEFWAALRRELPNSFRFTGSKGHALFVQQRLKDHYIPEIEAIDQFEGEKVEPPSPIPWYPDGLAWVMTTTKKVVRRSAPFASFQKFLVSETGVGNISRQEAVSMIPPLLMDVKPHMTVLDLCAAPGSKAAQLIEMVHAGEESRVRAHLSEVASTTMDDAQDGAGNGTELEENVFDHGRSTGLLIANDADYKRSHLLVHQMKRLNSPNLIITNHDATMFPSIRLPGQKGYLKFDRILADVPCSGDGTPRKNPNVWKDWSPANGVGLHLTQVRILVRALQMLKVGGRVVYSTCSMNPVENEAVVATAIDRCGGLSRVKIIDCDAELPKLKRSPGLNDWNVMDKSGRVWHNWKEVEEEKNRDKAHGLDRLVKGMFPPSRGRDENEGENEQIPLHRCLRVHAHLQDTGAFFITVLEKLSEIRLRPESEPKRRGPKPPVIALAEEISARSENAASSTSEPLEVEELQTLNDLVPIQEDLSVNASAAARQNRDDVLPQRQNATVKRDRDPSYDAGDAAMTSKRSRTRDEPDDLATKEDEDRHTHLPPSPAAQPHEAQTASPLVVSSKKKTRQPFEEPFKYLPMDHDELNIIYDFYDISPEFPRDRFMVRNLTGEPAKAIYYTAGFARDILTDNEGKGLKFVHCGVKMFVKQDIQKHGICKWRIQTEGLSILEPWVGEKRVVRLHKQETLKKLLVEMFPKVSDYGWRELGEIGERVRDIELGCCVLRIEPSDAPDGFRERMVLPLWRSMHSLNLMLPKLERQELLLRLYGDETPLQHHIPGKSTQPGTESPQNEMAVDESDPEVGEGCMS